VGTTRNENYLNYVFLLKMAKAKQGKYLTKQDITHLSEAQRMQELEMYTGNKKQIPREEWLYNFEAGSISKDIITLPECIERCFLEPLTNASDNVHRSRRFDVVAGKLYVFVSSTRIIIENSGTPIPVAYKEDEGMYVPELIFGVPGSSSHYTEEIRHEAGVNGLGVKLTNVFSKYFEIEILDPINKKSYKQVWENMGLEGKHEPIVEPYNKKESLVRVIFNLDYGHFGYTNHQAPKEVFPLFARHCADISFTTKVPVTFEYEMPGAEPQAIEFEVGHPRNYAHLYFGEAVENSLLHYEWPKGTKIIKHEDGQQTSKNPKVIPLVEMCVVDTPDNSENISFVNSMMTRDGGVHVEAALKSVSDHIVKFVNSKDEDGLTITLKHVRPNISLVMACMVKNPSFSGQTKNKLSGPKPFTPRIDITEKEVKPVMKWQMIQHLLAILEAKKNALLAKSDGKKSRNVSTKNGRNANHAGKRRSKECTLFIVEGLSASSYPKKWVDNIENGRDFYGWLPIRGKFLNVMKAKAEKIGNNREIAELKKMLRLEEGLDYADPENFKRLRYGRVVIMADSDDDGKHIVALLLLYFHCRFPSLLQMGYVYNYLTPIIRVIKGKRSNKFYTAAEYEKWKRRNKNHHTWKTIYFKGLGRTTDAQIREDYMDQRIIHCLYDDYAPQTIRLAFSTQQRDERKAWLAHFSKVLEAEIVEQQPISEFINTELVKYGQLGLRRAIPNEVDGFKDSQRKVMWGAFKIWDTEKDGKIKCGNAKYKEMKVARIAARAAEHTNYHHGERSLEGTIVAMAQDFPGANNLPFFARDGQFGCVDPNTPVLLWDGRTKMASDIRVGDELIGDDEKKRTVSRVVSGIDEMYEVSQTHGNSYVVNSIHILTLINSKGEVIDIQIQDYLKRNLDEQKKLFGFKVESGKKILSEIKIKSVGRGPYCGWYIDGNERFLLGDYTVTHNTRDMGGKDAADARYAETKPEWWIPYVFRREDLPILELKEDEGEEIEPVSFYPILPTVLINGCNGIALAYSTFIPNHNPIDVINWLKAKIEGKSLPLLKPWYRGFSGSIEVIDRRTKTRKRRAKQLAVPEERVSDIPDPESPTIPSLSEFNDNEQDTITTSEEEQNKDEPDFMKEIAEYVRDYREERGRPLYSLITKGEFYTAKNGKVVITELPIGRWTHPYLKWLEKLRDEDKVIKDVRDVSKSDVPGFELTGFQPIPSYKSLQLKSQIGMSNMVLLDTENKPHRYDTVTDYLEVFYKFRLSKYEVRKAFILENWSKKIHDLREKQRFIRAVVNKELIIESRSKEDVFRDMNEMGMEHALLTETQVVKLTEDEITKLEDKINVLQNDIEILEATSPEKLWLQELREFEREYRKYYKLPARGDKLRIKIKTGR